MAQQAINLRAPLFFLKCQPLSQRLKDAFESVPKSTIIPSWIAESEIESIKEKLGEVVPIIVIDLFDGDTFKRLKDLADIQLISAFALLKIVPRQIQDIPLFPSPVESLCMCGIRVTISGLHKNLEEYKSIYKKIRRMGGEVIKDGGLYKRKTTHIVSPTWYSKVVNFVRQNYKEIPDISVMDPRWVHYCYEKRETIESANSDHIIKKFRLPVFYNMRVSTTGFDQQENKDIQTIVTKKGGKFTPSLILPRPGQDFTSHLIVKKPSGIKYERALNESPDIFMVNLGWLLDSNTNDCLVPLPEEKYSMKPKQHSSFDNTLSDESVRIPAEVTLNSQQVDENQTPNVSELMYKKIKDILAKRPDKKIFDSQVFYICGINSLHHKDVVYLIRSAGGRVYEELFNAITHLLVGHSHTTSDISRIKEYEEKNGMILLKVDLKWLFQCIEEEKFIAETCDEGLKNVFEGPQKSSKRSFDETFEVDGGRDFMFGAISEEATKKIKITNHPRRSLNSSFPLRWDSSKNRSKS